MVLYFVLQYVCSNRALWELLQESKMTLTSGLFKELLKSACREPNLLLPDDHSQVIDHRYSHIQFALLFTDKSYQSTAEHKKHWTLKAQAKSHHEWVKHQWQWFCWVSAKWRIRFYSHSTLSGILKKPVLEDVRLFVRKSGRYAILGKNGYGKSKFLWDLFLNLKQRSKENVYY